MNPATIFAVIGSLYLVIIAYGVVRTRKKGLPLQLRFAAASAQVVLPPVLLFIVLMMSGAPGTIGGWAIMLVMLLVAGALLAVCTDLIARRVL